MSDYIKATNFAAKDVLPSGNSGKIIKGTEIDVELTAIASAIASKADSASPTFTGTPAAPTAAAGTNTTQIATTAFVTTAAASAVPAGVIVMWSGSVVSIPSGWALCDGANGTPDLRNRFVVGAGSTYAVAATGGATTVTATGSISGTTAGTALTEAQMPKHFHQMAGPGFVSGVPQNNGGGYGTFNGGTPDDGGLRYGTWSTGGGASSGSESTGSGNGNEHTHGAGSLAFTGNAVNSLPPYYALAYIMKTA